MEQLSSDDESYTVQLHPESARVDDISRLLGTIINRRQVGGRDGDVSEKNTPNATPRDALLQKLKHVLLFLKAPFFMDTNLEMQKCQRMWRKK